MSNLPCYPNLNVVPFRLKYFWLGSQVYRFLLQKSHIERVISGLVHRPVSHPCFKYRLANLHTRRRAPVEKRSGATERSGSAGNASGGRRRSGSGRRGRRRSGRRSGCWRRSESAGRRKVSVRMSMPLASAPELLHNNTPLRHYATAFLHDTAMHSHIALYTILHYTSLHHTILHNTTLHYNTMCFFLVF